MADISRASRFLLLFSVVVTYDQNIMAEPELIKKSKRLRRICSCSLAVVVLCVVGVYAYGS